MILLVSGLFACDQSRVYEKNLSIKNGNWSRKDKAQFEFEIIDSTGLYDLYLNFRHAGDFPYRNIYLFTQTTGPDGRKAIDTAQMILADSKGRWMGKGIGDLYDYQFKFKQAVQFPRSGAYTFQIQQGMRDFVLPSVSDIGIRVEKINLENGGS